MFCVKTKKILKILLFLIAIFWLFYFKTANAAVLKTKVCVYDMGDCAEWNGSIKFEVIGPFNRISKTPLFNRSSGNGFPKVLGTSSPGVINLPSTGGAYKFYQIHYVSDGPKEFSGKAVSLARIRDLNHTTFSGKRIGDPCFRDSNVCDGVLSISDSNIKTIVFIFDFDEERKERNLTRRAPAERIIRQTATRQRNIVFAKTGETVLVAATEKTNEQKERQECNYLLEYLKYGRKNNPLEMIKLQSFLKGFEGFKKVNINKKFDIPTLNAVYKFQKKYEKDVLDPWALPGSTGYVYITTKKKINELYCDREFPLTEAQKQEIKEYRALMLSLK